MQPAPTTRPRIIVIGCGFGGLTFCNKFRGKADITLIDRQNHHLFQPLLYQVAMAGLSAPDVSEPIRSLFRKRPEIRTIMDTVTGIDLQQREVHLDLGKPQKYDYLVIAMGGRTAYFGNDHWAEHAPGIKSLDDALRVRRQVLTSFELAESIDDLEERRKLTTIVVVGGGPTGVELAGAMAELAHVVFKRDFRYLDPSDTQVILIDGGDRLLSAFPPELSESAKKQLEHIGVEVRLNLRVKDIDEDGVLLNDGTRIETRNVLWGGGVKAPDLTQHLGVALGAGGRIVVGPDLSVPDHPEVFVIGDVADATNPDGTKVPGLAPAAMQMGKHVARILRDALATKGYESRNRPAFKYIDKGTMATIGRKHAIAWIGRIKLSGLLAWLAWLVVHLMLLVGFRNKIVVLIQWGYAYLSFRRGARIIFGRDKLIDEVEQELLEKSAAAAATAPAPGKAQPAGTRG